MTLRRVGADASLSAAADTAPLTIPRGRLAANTIEERSASAEDATEISNAIQAQERKPPRAIVAGTFPWAPAVLLALSIVLWASALPKIDLSQMSDYGLISVLPVQVWVAFAVFMVSVGVCLWHSDRAGWLLLIHVLAFIVM